MRARRVLLRRMVSKVSIIADRLPCVVALVPGDALELRRARWLGTRMNAVLEVFVVRACRSFLRGMIAQVCPLALRPPLAFLLVPVGAFAPRISREAETTAQYENPFILLLLLVPGGIILVDSIIRDPPGRPLSAAPVGTRAPSVLPAAGSRGGPPRGRM